MRLHTLISVLCTLLLSAGSVAQAGAQTPKPTVTARFTPDSIAIGDHFDLEVTVEKDMMQMVDFPGFDKGMFTDWIEILEDSPVDTLSQEGRRIRLAKKYRLTTFEEGTHWITGFPVLYVDKNIVDTLRSPDSLFLQVGTFEIDTLTQTIRDIKSVMDAPLKFGEIGGYILWAWLAVLAVAALVWWLIRRRRNLTLFGKPKPVDPPHVAAIKALEVLHSQKLWQNNKHKLYYTRLTDILREYLDGRYGIHAMEMTSDEILASLAETGIPQKNYADLKDILRTADLVKFAKLIPSPEENESAYTHSYYFVEETKSTEIEPPTEPEELK